MKNRLRKILMGLGIVFVVTAIIFILQINRQKNTESAPVIVGDQVAEEDVYKMPSVLYLRQAIDAYLNGTGEKIISSWLFTKEDMDAFSRSYYESKFIVLDIMAVAMGGDEIKIMFQNQPDKVFFAWVYWNKDNPGYYDLRGFGEERASSDYIKEFINQPLIKSALNDKERAL